jgi:phage baseplate assembly protein W
MSNYSLVVTGADLQRLQIEVNEALEGYEARIEALEAKLEAKSKPVAKETKKAA